MSTQYRSLKALLFLEWSKACWLLPLLPALTHSELHSVHIFPCSLPFRSTVCRWVEPTRWLCAAADRPHSLQRHVLLRSELKLVSLLRKWNSVGRRLWEVKWRRKEFSWTEKPSLVPSVWIHWRIRWLFPVDTATAWTVLKATGMKRMRSKSTAALSAGSSLHRGLSWWKTPCWQI